jgi:hypothetical protein
MDVKKTNKTGHFSLCLSAVKPAHVRFGGLLGDLFPPGPGDDGRQPL